MAFTDKLVSVLEQAVHDEVSKAVHSNDESWRSKYSTLMQENQELYRDLERARAMLVQQQ